MVSINISEEPDAFTLKAEPNVTSHVDTYMTTKIHIPEGCRIHGHITKEPHTPHVKPLRTAYCTILPS